MNGKLHIPALWLDASRFSPFFQKIALRSVLSLHFRMLVVCLAFAQTAFAGVGERNILAPDLTLEITGPASAACVDTITVAVTVSSGFTDIASLQYSINWDETQVMYLSSSAANIGGAGGDPLLGTGNTAGGELTYSWVDFSGTEGEDLADGDTLLTITFVVLTDVGTVNVDITGTPLAMEVADNFLATSVPTALNNVSVALTPIVVTCPPDITVLENDVPFLLTGGLPLGGMYTGLGVNNDTLDPTAVPLGINTITYTYTDINGCSNSCTFDVTVEAAPAVICPDDISVCIGEAPFPLTGESPPGGTYTGPGVTAGVFDPLAAGPGVHIVTYSLNPVDTCFFVISVYDTAAPPAIAYTFPDSFNVNVTPGNCSATVTIERPNIGLLCLIPIFDNYTVFDCDISNLAPVEGPANVNGVNDSTFLDAVQPLDVCDPLTKFVAIQFPVGTTIIPYTWCDNDSNCTTINITVVVNEPEPPQAQCKTAIISLDANGQVILDPALVNDGSTDNCGPVVLSVSPDTFTCANVGGNTVVLTVDDLSPDSPSSTCTTTVTVLDDMAPMVNCPVSITVSADSLSCNNTADSIPGLLLTALPTGTSPSNPGEYSDNCGVSTITYNLSGPSGTVGSGDYPIPGNQVFNGGVTTVIYTIRDTTGNTTVCSFDVTVEDLIPPVTANCPPDITVNANNGCLAFPNWTPPVFTDNCAGTVQVLASHNPGGFFIFGPTLVTYTATDVAGNVAICTFIVEVVDNQPPSPSCQNITVSLDANGVVTVSPIQLDDGSTDNCFYDYVNPDTTFNCTNAGDNPYTLTLIDGSGNTASVTCTVTVVDDSIDIKDPVITNCGSFTPAEVDLDANCSGTLDAADFALNFTFTDNTLNSMPSCPLTFDVDVDGSGFAPTYEWNCADTGANVVTLRVSDVFGNTAVCVVTIIVNDVTPPVIVDAEIVAPLVVTVECHEYDADDFATLGQITLADVTDACDDACDGEITIAFTDVATPGACPNTFTITRTWAVTDEAGNTAYHTQTLNVVDTQAPIISGVQTLLNLEANTPIETPACAARDTIELLPENVSDSCTVDFTDFIISYEIDFEPVGVGANTSGTGAVAMADFPIGTSEVTFTVADSCGNSSQVTITVVVDDVDGPNINEPFADDFGNTKLVCDSIFVIPNATGNCGNNFSWYRPFRADDSFLDCSDYNVTEEISTPSVQIAVNVSVPFVYTNPPFFSINPTIFFPVGPTTITYTATDMEGNSSVCSFTVIVEDTEPPTLICPPAQILPSTCEEAQIPDYTNLVQVSDNCPSIVDLVQMPIGGTMLDSLFGAPPVAGDVFTVTIIGTELFNADTCSFTVTLADGDAPIPVLAVLPDLIDSCGSIIVVAPAALDPCNPDVDTLYGTPSTPVGIFLNTNPPSYQLNPGNFVITWIYNDGNGNISTQPQNISVLNDTFPPTAICQPNLTLELSAAGDVLIDPADLDLGSLDPNDCGPLTLSTEPTVLDCDDLAIPALVALKVADQAGNVAVCTTAITVLDVTAPELSPIPANDTLEACSDIPTPANITATDACDLEVEIVFVEDTISFVNNFNYTIRRTWTASDDSGNASTGTQFIVVQDSLAPVFVVTTPDTLFFFTGDDDPDCMVLVGFDITPFVTDCDSNLVITNNVTGQGADYSEMLTVGTYTVVFTATDNSGLSATHAVVLIVRDDTDPIAACINGVSVSLQASGTVTVTPLNINSSSSDNCTAQIDLGLSIQRLDTLGPITNSITFGCPEADGVTQHPVRLIVEDEAGNEAACETYIIVQDNVFPTITSCPPNDTVQCDDDLSPDVQGTATGADNCNLVTAEFVDSTAIGTGSICTVIFRTWSVSDQAGNAVTCVQVLSVQDTIKPVFASLPSANDTLNCGDTLAIAPVVTATDNCTDSVAVTLVVDTLNIGAGNCGLFSYTIQRTWTAVDDCGNSSVFSQQITVADTVAPQFVGLPDTITLFTADFPPNLTCLVPLAFAADSFLTDCAPDTLMTLSNNAPHGDGELDISGDYTAGTYTVIFSATDPCGNVGVDSIVVQIVDNSIPTVVCNDEVVVSLGTNGQATISPSTIDLGSTDNCGIDTMFLSDSTFDCGNLGFNSVTLTVVDASGNSNFCTVNVEVLPGVGGTGFSLDVTGSPESYFGADDGSASAVAAGGSGQFTFTWSNGATGPNISGLSAGIYTVTVVDSLGGCTRVDTAIVDAGAKIVLSVGAGVGCQGQIISIPVTVDNFFDVTGFTFTVHVNEDSVGTILGVTNGSVHPSIADELDAILLTGNNLGIEWADTSVTLPSGTVLFSIDVQLGMAIVGSASPVVIVDTPVVILFTQDSSGVNVVTSMLIIGNDTIRITCELSDLIEIGGDIQTWNNPQPVPGVEVTLAGTVSATQTTGPPGTYLFGIPNNSNTTVRCYKETAGLAGITGADILLIKRHVLGLQLLTSPYQYVAADVSGEGNISVLDVSRIQPVALGLLEHIPNSPDWKFVPKSYVFPTPPLSVPFPDSISHLPATMSFLDDDFVAVRMGDVNGSIVPTFTNDDIYDRSETFRIRVDERSFQAGEVITVPFKASDFTDRSGFQMTLQFDPNVLELVAVQPGALPDMSLANFGEVYSGNGLLTTLWVSPVPLTLADGEVFFTLKFKALRKGASLAELLYPGSDITRAEAYDRDGNTMKVDFEFVQPTTGVEAAVFALYQNQPNPFHRTTTISFRLPESCEAQLRIFDASGRMLAEKKAQYPAGRNEETLDLGAATGVLWYELVTPFGILTKKMVAAQK